MRKRLVLVLLAWFFVCWGLITVVGMAAETETPPPPLPPPPPPPGAFESGSQLNAPPLKLVSPGVLEIGGCKIFKKARKVEFPAVVNMDKGLLEYLIVGRSGKVHESLLRTDVEPYALQIALLLVGLEGSPHPLMGQGDPRAPEGDRVDIRVRWMHGGKSKEARPEEWTTLNKRPISRMPWVFTGSMIVEGVFLAQVEKSIVAVYHDPAALIDHQLAEGASDEVWFVAEGKVPPAGTEVTVSIAPEPRSGKTKN